MGKLPPWTKRWRVSVERYVLAIFLLTACHRGDYGEECNADGTCNAPALVCNGRCWMRPPASTCSSEADCFCDACLKRCGSAGIKRCEFTDVSVWGSKPTVCECRQ